MKTGYLKSNHFDYHHYHHLIMFDFFEWTLLLPSVPHPACLHSININCTFTMCVLNIWNR